MDPGGSARSEHRAVRRVRALLGHAALALAWTLSATIPSRYAGADPDTRASAGTKTKTAAELYDQAVRLYDAARYSDAARAFLAADELSPSLDALESAIASARRASDHLLVVTAAGRVLGRETQNQRLATEARLALTQAERNLARVELTCVPLPCALFIDGKSVAAGLHHLLPGSHTFRARAGGATDVEERLSYAAGSVQRLELAIPAGTALAPVPAPAPANPSQPSSGAEAAAHQRSQKPLPPWAFYTGVGVTGALAILSIWSGADALSAKHDYSAATTRTAEQRDSVYARAHRTDFLWLGTVALAGLTTYAGIALVDWHGKQSSLRAGLALDRAGLAISGEIP